jgi:arginase
MRDRLRHPISPSRFRYVWAHVADDGDREFQVEHDLCWLGDDKIVSGPIHIHFDLDVLDPKEFPYLAYPESDGMPVARAATLLGRLGRDGDVVGLTITEFAPACPEDAETGVRTVSALYAALG